MLKEEIELESNISHYFMRDNGVTTHFRYKPKPTPLEPNRVELSVFTSSRTNGMFLFHSITGEDTVTSLSLMLHYIMEEMPSESNYTISWTSNNDKNLETKYSYFRGSNLDKILSKFWNGKSKDEISILEIKLNPIS